MTHTLQTLEGQVIACRKCPRLVAWREEVAHTKRKAYLDQDLLGQTGARVRRPAGPHHDRRLGTRRTRLQSHRPHVHRRCQRGLPLPGPAPGGFRQPAACEPCGDGLALHGAFITAICRCVPPQNRPKTPEIRNCLPWLAAEIDLLPNLQGFVALGKVAFDGILRMYAAQNQLLPKPTFGHNAFYQLGEGNPWLLASYHPSQQNTLTGRLTEAMFDAVWDRVKEVLGSRE
jgi:uracil-DNA glycosylase